MPRAGRAACSPRAATAIRRPSGARLAHVVTDAARLPRDGVPQVALMGRSNVGKSSLLNRLLGRRALARVSKTPGRTREIHFYSVDEGVYIVDLPGFGFARVSRSERLRWAEMVQGYLDSGAPLALALQLVDARHEPTALDRMLAEFLTERGLPRLVVLTKADKLSGSELPRALSRTRRALGVGREDPLVATSARTGRGMNELSSSIASAIGKDERRNEESS